VNQQQQKDTTFALLAILVGPYHTCIPCLCHGTAPEFTHPAPA
jgi:hypothetical protein